MVKLSDLIEEQKELQEGYERSRSLDDYSTYFDFSPIKIANKDASWMTKGIRNFLESCVRRKGYAVWVDMGSGNCMALREGKMYIESLGYDPKVLSTYGYDALPISESEQEIRVAMGSMPLEFPPDVLKPKYAPKFCQADIATVKFPEKPDIVTSVEVLGYTEDPLGIFANAARQSPVGTIFCITDIFENCLTLYKDEKTDQLRCKRVIDKDDTVPGFSVMSWSDRPCEGVVMVKELNLKDYTYGYVFSHKLPASRLFSHSKFAHYYELGTAKKA